MNIHQHPKQVLFNSQGQPIGFFIKLEHYDSLLKEIQSLKDRVNYLKVHIESGTLPDAPSIEAFSSK